jgi:hypothetical protein
MARASRTRWYLVGVLGVAAATFGALWAVENLNLNAPSLPPPRSIVAPPPAPAPPPDPVEDIPEPDLGREPQLIDPREVALTRDPVAPKPRPEHTPSPKPSSPADTEPPPLTILEPAARSFLTQRPVVVRVRSEPSAQVTAGGTLFREGAAGAFAGELDLPAGPQQITVAAVDLAGNRREASVQVTVVDLDRLQGNRKRFQGLLTKLGELHGLAREIDQRIADLLRDMQSAPPETIESLSNELRYVNRTRAALEQEVDRAIQELEATLAMQARP